MVGVGVLHHLKFIGSQVLLLLFWTGLPRYTIIEAVSYEAEAAAEAYHDQHEILQPRPSTSAEHPFMEKRTMSFSM